MLRGPKDSYIEFFMEHLKDQETPSEYDFWAALWTIGAVVGRNCYVDRPRAPIFLNWYVVLCAESGMTRKSTAISFASKVIDGVLDENVLLIENKTTPEKLWLEMSTRSKLLGEAHAVITISEMVTFLGREGYALGMPGLLTDLYDCPDKRVGGGSISGGARPILNPFVTFLSGSTPTWLTKAINPDVIEGGFTSRCIFISSEHRKKLYAWPSEQRRDLSGLRDFLRKLRSHALSIGKVSIDDEAKTFFVNWYKSRRYSQDPYRRSFESREDGHVLRAAACICLSRLASTVNVQDLQLAVDAVTRAKVSGYNIFREHSFDLKLAHGLDKLREVLLDAGKSGIKNDQLFLKCRYQMKPGEYNVALDVLVEQGAVKLWTIPGPSGRGRPSRYYAPTTKLLNPEVWKKILRAVGITRQEQEPTSHDETTFEPLSEVIAETEALDNSSQILSSIEIEYPTTHTDTDHNDPDQDR